MRKERKIIVPKGSWTGRVEALLLTHFGGYTKTDVQGVWVDPMDGAVYDEPGRAYWVSGDMCNWDGLCQTIRRVAEQKVLYTVFENGTVREYVGEADNEYVVGLPVPRNQ